MKTAMRVLGVFLGVAAMVLSIGSASAAAYPAKPLKIVVGFPPGGGNDIVARVIGQKLGERLGQPVIIENKPGANSIIATEYVAKSAPDGYTLYVGASGAMTFNPGLYEKLPYDPVKDFAPVAQLASFPLVMAVHPSVQANSIRELIALAKAQPGKLFYGAGSTPFQVATELFKKQAGVSLTHVPYKGSAASITAAVGGEIQVLTVDAPPALAQIRAGKLRALAVTGPKRLPDLNVPTMAEAGMPDYEVQIWIGLFAPAATPRAVVDKLHSEVAAILKADDVKQRFATLGMEPTGIAPAEFGAILKADLDKWTRVAREGNIRAE